MKHNALIAIDSHLSHHSLSFGGLVTNAIDLAKIGRLYLNRGMWEGKRIVSEEWITNSMTYDESNHGYHYGLRNISSFRESYNNHLHTGFFAYGIHNQNLYINTSLNTICVRLGDKECHNTLPLSVAFDAICTEWIDRMR